LRHTGKPIDGQLQLLLDKKRCRPHAAPRLGLKLFCRRFEIDAFRSVVQLLDADIVSTGGPHIDGESRGASLWGAKHVPMRQTASSYRSTRPAADPVVVIERLERGAFLMPVEFHAFLADEFDLFLARRATRPD
jgi:hypothetical protein